ncbi:pentapeptide repeat-containing protein, partial [Verrucomicrobia bacterium]|nr:pentapeptide repeat-containing protein [Verrucomicrobiota bacterium]
DCTSLTSVTFEGNAPQLGNNAFQDYKIAGGYIVGPGVDLKGADLSGADLSGANLSKAALNASNLTGANLTGARLNEADLTGANLRGANLTNAALNASNLRGANLEEANLEEAQLNVSKLIEANLTGANLTNAEINSAELNGSNLPGANLTNAALNGSNLRGANLEEANLEEAQLNGADLTGANLEEANLEEANLNGANLTEAKLNESKLNEAQLNGAKLNEANLTGANLTGAKLEEANLEGADLSSSILIDVRLNAAYMKFANLAGAHLMGANLTGANLTGANLTGANLAGADLTEAKLNEAQLNGAVLIGANLIEVELNGAQLNGVILEEANLTGANLTGANLYGATLAGAHLMGANLAGATLTGATLTGAKLNEAKLIGLKSGNITGNPLNLPAGYKITGGYLVGPEVDLRGADLTGVDLMDANLTKTKLQGAALVYALNPHGIIQANPGGEITGIPKSLPKWFQVVDGYIKEVTDPPVIRLIGNDPLILEALTIFKEPGALVSDDKDGDLDLKIDGDVDTETLGTYNRTYETTDSTGNKTKVTRVVKVVDTTAPVITLKGKSKMDHEAGTPYTSPGATAVDALDGSVVVELPNKANDRYVGGYSLTYKATDKAGNEATVTRKVNVVDTTPPVIILEGDSVVTHEAGTPYQDKGATANDTYDGKHDWHQSGLKVHVTGEVQADKPGTYKLTYDVIDFFKNQAETVTRTVNVSDRTAPVITLKGEAEVTHEAATKYVDKGAIAEDTLDGNISSKVTVTGEVEVATVGEYTLTYKVKDAAENPAKEVTRVVKVVDTTKPHLSVDWLYNFKKHEAGEEFKYPAATASDTVDGDVTRKIVRTSNIVNSKKPGDDYFIKYEVKDAADNETTKTLPVYIVDTTAPVIEVKDALILRKIGDSLNDPGVTVTDNAEGVPAPKVTNNSSEKVDLKNTGKYVVTYTAADDASNSSSATRTFVVLPSPELNGIGTESYPNSEVKIPFRVKDFNKLTAMSLKMEWDKDLLQLVRQGKNPQLLADSSLVSSSNFNFEKPGSLSFLWMASLQQTSGLTLPDDTVLFSLYFKLVGPAGEKGVITIPANTFLTSNFEGYEDSITESSTGAIIDITDKADITGEVSFWGDTAKPINVASIVLASSRNENRNSKSASNGDFAIADTKISESYEISADYQDQENEHANKGVNVLDLIKIRKHILAKAPFERPFSLIAADVDRNKTIDVMDLVAIRKVILMKQKYYKSSNVSNSNWQFLSTDFQVANISESFDAVVKFQKRTYTGEPWHITGADFIGIKLGDVNGDWWTNSANNNQTKMNRFNTHDALVKFGSGKNEELNIPLYATSGKNLMGIELEMSWDPDVVELEDVSSQLLGMSFSDGNINIGEGSVSIVWDDPFVRGMLVDLNSPLFDFNFARIGDGATGMTIKSGMMVDSQEQAQSIQPASVYVHADNRFKPAMNGLIKNIDLDGDQVVLVVDTDKQRAYELQSASSLIEQHWNKHSIFEGNGQWQEIVVEREKVDTYLRAVPIIENVE